MEEPWAVLRGRDSEAAEGACLVRRNGRTEATESGW